MVQCMWRWLHSLCRVGEADYVHVRYNICGVGCIGYVGVVRQLMWRWWCKICGGGWAGYEVGKIKIQLTQLSRCWSQGRAWQYINCLQDKTKLYLWMCLNIPPSHPMLACSFQLSDIDGFSLARICSRIHLFSYFWLPSPEGCLKFRKKLKLLEWKFSTPPQKNKKEWGKKENN